MDYTLGRIVLKMEKQIYNFLEEKLHSLVGLNSEDIKMDMKLDAPPISISSYDIVQLYAEMEEYFSVRIPDEYLFINKIEDIVKMVNDLIKKNIVYQRKIDELKNKLFEE